jgi:DnaJ-class molecular chaperone
MSFYETKKSLESCAACGGSGFYDSDENPPCDACNGTGEVKLGEQIESYALYKYTDGYDEATEKIKNDIRSIFQENSPTGAKLAKIREYLKIEPQDQ